ncbi:putative sm-like protein Lsm6/SmF [Helianthus annuus]|nr:putative sm-like protein Lsm6/SmF [Helianthus annuus]
MSGTVAAAEKGSSTTKTLSDFLKSIRGRPVVVKLNSGVDYRGSLTYYFSLCSLVIWTIKL